MKNLIITSANERVGKTTFCITLALRFRKLGYNVGYFKPISDRDDDVDIDRANDILNMSEDRSIINPVVISEWEYDLPAEQISGYLTKIQTAYESLNKSYDFLIIESTRTMDYLASLGLSSRELTKQLDAAVLLLVASTSEKRLDEIFLTVSYYNDQDINPLGAILTLVPIEIIERIKTLSTQILPKANVELLGVLPEKQKLTAPTVKEIAEIIHGRFLVGEEFADVIVTDYMVGAMELESALKYFRKSTNKAVIIGGDRPSLAIAAMETDTSVIILTGNIYPPQSVLSSAHEKKISVLLAGEDTYTVVQKLVSNPVYGIINSAQADKLKGWDELLSEVNIDRLLEKLQN